MATVYCIRRGTFGKRLIPMDLDDAARELAAGSIRKIGHNLFTEETQKPFVREVLAPHSATYQTADMQPVKRGPGRPRKVVQ